MVGWDFALATTAFRGSGRDGPIAHEPGDREAAAFRSLGEGALGEARRAVAEEDCGAVGFAGVVGDEFAEEVGGEIGAGGGGGEGGEEGREGFGGGGGLDGGGEEVREGGYAC